VKVESVHGHELAVVLCQSLETDHFLILGVEHIELKAPD
jgi:hypothetical protein